MKPYADEKNYEEHDFYKSIETVNVGGLPFLPSATKMVRDFLEELITDSPEAAFERDSAARYRGETCEGGLVTPGCAYREGTGSGVNGYVSGREFLECAEVGYVD